jgi:hypothetical protein
MLGGCASAPPASAPDAPAPHAPTFASEFWVSPEGDDAAPGTRLAPFRTLERARNAVRELPADSPSPPRDIAVSLREGVYRLAQPFVLDARDSGRNGRDIVYRAAPGEHPVISGSIRVENWSPVPGSPIYKAFVGPRASRQLYVDGRRATRARTENYPEGFLPSFARGGIEFIPAEANPAGWRNPESWKNLKDVEAVIVTQWKMMSVPLDSIAPSPGGGQPGLIRLQEPGWTNANVFYMASPSQPGIWSFWQVTRFENAYEFLDQPGEWYLDRASGWLYYRPRPGEDLDRVDVELPVLETLIEGKGEQGSPVTHVRFEGLTFAHATWLGPSSPDGYVSDQSGFHLVGNGHQPNVIGHDSNDVRTPGNVRFRFAHEIELRGNIFEHLGGVGLDFDTGSQGNTIESNLFTDISSAAIQLGGIGPDDHHPTHPEQQLTSGNVISNNLIREVAREFVDAAGIYVGFAQGSRIEHNTIVDVPWSGIALGWGWGLLDLGGFPGLPGAKRNEWGTFTTPTPNRGNRITHNRIHGFLNELWDGGAIYTTGWQGTSPADGDALLIEGNVADGKRPKGGGNTFYTDGGTRYVTLRDNASYDNPQGVTDFGPAPKFGDPLPYSFFPSLLDGLPYGSENGGCRTFGDLFLERNYGSPGPKGLGAELEALLAYLLLHETIYSPKGFFGICPFQENGVSYPTGLTYRDNHVIRGKSDIPARILRDAGVRERPATIPSDRWILPPP